MDHLPYGTIRLSSLVPTAYGKSTRWHSQHHCLHRRCHHPYCHSRTSLASPRSSPHQIGRAPTQNQFGEMLLRKHRGSLPGVRPNSRRHPARPRKTSVAQRHATSQQSSPSSPIHWTMQLFPKPHQGLRPHFAASAPTDEEKCRLPSRPYSG